MNVRLLSYGESVTIGAAQAGGKGWNLGRLQRYGFAVPEGFVVAADIYRQFLRLGRLPERTARAEALTATEVLTPVAKPILDDIAEELLHGLQETVLLCELQRTVAAELERRGLANVPLAVRSSATAEDGTVASFAGIHESYLSVVGASAVCQAILHCYASLWSARAVAYRRQMKIPDDELAAAVVICRMVQPIAAGVAFSCDPATGRRDVVVLNLTRGLGEGVVSGRITPERVVVQMAGNRPRILEQPDDSILDAARYIRLAETAWRVQGALGDGEQPQDVELALTDDELWLLQARPVTRLPRFTFEALAHQPVHWSNANFKDSLPHPLTAFTWSMVQRVIGDMLFAAQDAAGYPVQAGMELVRRFQGRPYFDVSLIQWTFYDSLGITPAEVNRTMGGFQPEIEVPAGNPMRGKAGRKRSLARLRFFRQLWSLPREAPQRYEELIDAVRKYRKQDLRGMSRRELASELTRWLSVTPWLQPSLQIAAAYYGAWLTQLRALLELRLGEKTDLFVSQLLAASGNVTSAEQAYRLWELADPAREEAGDRLQTIDALSPHLRRELDRYLDAFGHRAVGEMEIANARWIEDAGYLLEQIAIYVELPKGISPRGMAVKVRREAEEKLSTLPLMMRPLVRWMLHRVRLGAALREQAKSACVASMEPLRKIGLEAGRRLVAAGELVDVDDVWQLTLADLEAYLEGTWDGRGAAALTADRKDAWVKWQSEPPPADLITCSPAGQQTVRVKHAHSPSLGDDTWLGTLAAPGYARGCARILLDPKDGERLQAGDILVAPSTDPGWTPLFLRAAAIVMETGGYLSHGAVVAREFGIPAVINIPGILTQLRDGDELIVDANASLVTRVAATSKSPSLPHNPVLNAE